jgi:type I restriction enzyme S subunit
MNRYPKYRPSGIEWIGEIPEHWSVSRIKSFVKSAVNGLWGEEPVGNDDDIVCVRVADFDMDRLSVDDGNLTVRNVLQKDRGGRMLRQGDLLIEKSGGGQLQPVGRVVRFNLPCMAVSSNFVSRLDVDENDMIPSFLLYCFKSLYDKRVNTRAIKQTTGIQNLDLEAYLNERIAVASENERVAIATYLDDKTRKIDTLIEKKQRLIELLKEQRTAVINQAVTKGINPNVKMKHSGIEWIGEIPKHWGVKRLKYVVEIRSGDGISPESILAEGVFPVFGGNGIMGYTDRFNNDRRDIIIGRVGAKCGNIHVASGEKWISDNALRVETPEDVDFMGYLLTTMNLNNLANQNAQPLITGTMVRNQTVAVPPKEEQMQLVEEIKNHTSRVTETIDRAQKEINLLNEYRNALISEVVTGKIDVRDYVSGEND